MRLDPLDHLWVVVASTISRQFASHFVRSRPAVGTIWLARWRGVPYLDCQKLKAKGHPVDSIEPMRRGIYFVAAWPIANSVEAARTNIVPLEKA